MEICRIGLHVSTTRFLGFKEGAFGNDIILLVIYVDDIIIISSEERAIEQIKSNMSKTFDMTDLGLLHYCFGVGVWQIGSSIFVSQTKFARSFIDRFRMIDCIISSIPMEKG